MSSHQPPEPEVKEFSQWDTPPHRLRRLVVAARAAQKFGSEHIHSTLALPSVLHVRYELEGIRNHIPQAADAEVVRHLG